MSIDEEQALMWRVVKSVDCPVCSAKVRELCTSDNPAIHSERVDLYKKDIEITRVDAYTIQVGVVTGILASADQEARLRQMTPEQIRNFKYIMTGG